MSRSLQDQLLSLGLASKRPDSNRGDRKNKATRGKAAGASAQNRKKHVNRPSTVDSGEHDTDVSLDQAYALRKQEEQKQAENARRLKQEEIRRRRRLNKEIGAIVNEHRLNDPDAEVPRNFVYKGRIRKIHVTPDQLTALNAGKLGIAYLTGRYHLLAAEHIEAIRAISAEHVPDLAGESPDDEDHPVPDDLIW